MQRFSVISCLLFLVILSSCQSPETIDSKELDKHEIIQTYDETTEDDFIFRLISEKETYSKDEEVVLFGEIEYTGEKDEIKIVHSASAILFPIEEKVRGYHIPMVVHEIGVTSTLKRGIPYQKTYSKSGGFIQEDDSKDNELFMEDFFNSDGFPAGYYIVNGYADFAAELSDSDEELKRYTIEATVDFKVLE